ncbi:hypothetical protein GCM10027515_12750 [Schumannella luteola]|uniref:SipW-cognate class signal peptide n=1 Tax=Schumannella luteola TaxID=472059 RepID=A0A852Y625_9MICO|nr:hypothetical protein [Schumannella luteola]NYG97723.1 hypothetical protein [Schumannella luteola]TPX01410.1 hypothetical protein FJ656_27615 [Schumannella luteola]
MRNKKKIAALAIAAALVVGTGTAAFAYWTTTGSGTGSASTGTSGTVTIAQTSTHANLAPGAAAQTISGTVSNPAAASSSVYVTKVTVSISSVTKAANVSGTCDATDYTLSNADMTVGSDIAKGASANFTGATIAFKNKAENQDACKGATVNFSYAAS